MAIWGVGVMVGPILGPTLGGYLTDAYQEKGQSERPR
jgi:DHA2 family multidrug resistance protein